MHYWLILLLSVAIVTRQGKIASVGQREPLDAIGWLIAGFREGYLVDPGIFSD